MGDETKECGDFEGEIVAYRANDTILHSPVWIWFSRSTSEDAVCLLCGRSVRAKDSSTSGLKSHLKLQLSYRHFFSQSERLILISRRQHQDL